MAIERPKLKFKRGTTYTIDVSDPSNTNHPLRFTADSGATEYTIGVTATGTPGTTGAKVTFAVPENAPDNLNYYCTNHGLGMGNKMRTFKGFTWGGDRGLIAGGLNEGSNFINTIEYITISTPGNAIDFGDLTIQRTNGGTVSNGTRAVFGGGVYSGQNHTNTMDYVTVASPGNAIDFGDMTNHGYSYIASEGDGTYGIFGGGFRYSGQSYYMDIEYITVDTPSNSTSFGTLSGNQYNRALGTNGTIGVFATGTDENGNVTSNSMMTITMATPGNAVSSTGTLLDNWRNVGNLPGDNTYLLVGAGRRDNGEEANGWTYSVERFVTATQGGAQDFGDLALAGSRSASSSNGTYAYFAGRESATSGSGQSNGRYETIEQMSITTGGNATNFGTLNNYVESAMGISGAAA